MKIIVADDSRVMRKIIGKVILSLGYDVVDASDGQQVIDILGNGIDDVGLVVLDWNMPIMSGIEVLQTMQQESNYKSIPVLMVSTESEQADISRVIDAGAKNYVCKPFDLEDLAAKIKESVI